MAGIAFDNIPSLCSYQNIILRSKHDIFDYSVALNHFYEIYDIQVVFQLLDSFVKNKVFMCHFSLILSAGDAFEIV